jgi:hypothetical protein
VGRRRDAFVKAGSGHQRPRFPRSLEDGKLSPHRPRDRAAARRRQAPNPRSAPLSFRRHSRAEHTSGLKTPPGHFKLMVSPLSANENLNPTCRPCSRKTTPLAFERLSAVAPAATATPAPMAE